MMMKMITMNPPIENLCLNMLIPPRTVINTLSKTPLVSAPIISPSRHTIKQAVKAIRI
jgi:hypothetical protein